MRLRIGFIDCATNSVDVFDKVSEMAEGKVADLQLVHVLAPDFGKVPVCAKRLFTEGADSVIAFATASSQDSDLIRLVHDKVIDVEIQSGKFIFLVVVFDDEARTPLAMSQLAIKRTSDSIDHIVNLSAASPQKDAGAGEESALPMDVLSPPEIPDVAQGDSGHDTSSSGDSGVHSLF